MNNLLEWLKPASLEFVLLTKRSISNQSFSLFNQFRHVRRCEKKQTFDCARLYINFPCGKANETCNSYTYTAIKQLQALKEWMSLG